MLKRFITFERLIILLILLSFGVLVIFFYLSRPKEKDLTVATTSSLPEYSVSDREVDSLLKETGAIDQEGRVASINFQRKYVPNSINFVIQNEPFSNDVRPLQYFNAQGIPAAYGYGVQENASEYTIVIYLNPRYIDNLSDEERVYAVRSVVVKAALHIAAIGEGRPVDGSVKQEIFKQVPTLLDKYEIARIQN